jgi:hypothetical protein
VYFFVVVLSLTILLTRLAGTRLTKHKGAVVQISDFKPICSRVPLPQDRMSNEDFVVFECNEVSLLGGSGEAVFGQPKGVEQHPDISEWTKGLAQAGGAGYVLIASAYCLGQTNLF